MTNQNPKQPAVFNLTACAACIALGILFPQLFHFSGIPNAGSVFLPMHIPVLLCGFLCGWQYGLLCGMVTPVLSSVLFGMPPLFPVLPGMLCELMVYGLLTGLLFKRFNVYFSLIGAMLGGRIVSGVVNALVFGMADKPYGLPAFLTGAFVTALPGIVIQLVVVPLLVFVLYKAKFIGRSPFTNALASRAV